MHTLREREKRTSEKYKNQYTTCGDDYVAYPGYIYNHQTKKKRRYLLPIGMGYTHMCWVGKLGATTELVKQAEATYHKVDVWLRSRMERMVDKMFELAGFNGTEVEMVVPLEAESKYGVRIILQIEPDGSKAFSTSSVSMQGAGVCGETIGRQVLQLERKYFVCASTRGAFKNVFMKNLYSYLRTMRDPPQHTETIYVSVNDRYYLVEWGGSLVGTAKIMNILEVVIP